MRNIYLSKKTASGFSAPAATATPERFTTTQFTYGCKRLVVKGLASSRTNNAAIVYIGFASGTGTQQYDINPGEERTFDAPEGQLLDPYDFYVQSGTLTDGIWWNALNCVDPSV